MAEWCWQNKKNESRSDTKQIEIGCKWKCLENTASNYVDEPVNLGERECGDENEQNRFRRIPIEMLHI